MKTCAHWAPMIGARPGELDAEDERGLEVHLASCPACRARAADLAATEGLVAEALLAQANARDFSTFVDGVMARVDPASARAAGRSGLFGWLAAHRRLALGALAPAALALAVALVYVRGRSDHDTIAALELYTEGDVTMVLQTQDGPVVLLGEEAGG